MSNETTENITTEIIEKETETTEPKTEQKPIKKNKQAIAQEKIEQAKVMSTQAKEQIEECMHKIEMDIDEMNAQKQKLLDHTMHTSQEILTDLNIEDEPAEISTDTKVDLPSADDAEVEIKDLSSGRVMGVMMAILSGVALLAGWCLAASKSLGLPIPPEKLMDLSRLNKMLEWTSTQTGQSTNANIGVAILLVAVLLLAWLVYIVIVSLKASGNLKHASKTEDDVLNYCNSKEECKAKMKLVKAHIEETTKTLVKQRVLLDEQNAKLARARMFEDATEPSELHKLTLAEIQATQDLISSAKQLIETPIANTGELSTIAIETLAEANSTIDKHIAKIYQK